MVGDQVRRKPEPAERSSRMPNMRLLRVNNPKYPPISQLGQHPPISPLLIPPTTMSKSSLSSVVSNLVRASMGASVPSTVPDDDLDRHVAELILKEAKQKAEKYAKEGIRAYLPQ